MKSLVSFLPIIVLIAIFWLLIIRPAQRRQAQTVSLQKSIGIGDEVVLTSGIFGTVVEELDEGLRIEVADGVSIRVLRGAVSSKVNHDHDDEHDDEQADEHDDAPAESGDAVEGRTADYDSYDGGAVDRED